MAQCIFKLLNSNKYVHGSYLKHSTTTFCLTIFFLVILKPHFNYVPFRKIVMKNGFFVRKFMPTIRWTSK